MYILKLSGTIENTDQEDKKKEAIGQNKWISKKPAERMQENIKTYSILGRFANNHSTSTPNVYYKDSNVSPENALFLSKSCPNISTSYSTGDSSEDNSCSSNSTPSFITAPDATPAGSISSLSSCYSGQS